MRRIRSVASALCAILVLLVPPHPPAVAETPSRAFAVGGTALLPEPALAHAARVLGVTPTRVGGGDRYTTAAALSRHAHPGGAPFAYLARADDAAAALAAAQAVAVREAAVLLVDRDRLPDATAAELARLGARRVFVLGDTVAIADPVLDEVADVTGRRPRRLAGTADTASAAATAAALARHAHPNGVETVYVAAAGAAADQLAAVTGVVAERAALLLVDPDGVPEPTSDTLAELRPSRLVVVGGPAAVPDALLGDLAARTGVAPLRLRGPDRAATAEAVSRHAYPQGSATVYVAGAAQPHGAAAVAPAIAAGQGSLLLVDPHPPAHWTPRLDTAIAYARGRAGSVSFAVVGTDGVLHGHRADIRVPSASVLKVMFMAAHLRRAADRPLTATDRSLLQPMMRRSANEPASRIANQLGPGPMIALASEAGMRDFAYTRPWGLTRTSARDQARFLYDLERHLPERHRAEALRLLTEVVPEQRWGIGALPTPGWTVHFKGGWGSGSGAVDHQVALLRHPSGARAAAAVMTTGNPSHAYGTETLREVFRHLLADLP